LVGSSATFNTGTFFSGNVIASSSITVDTGAYINGRLFALTGAVTLNDNEVITFQTGALTTWSPTTPYTVGQIVFDGITYQMATTSGTSNSTVPAWNHLTAGTTTDNSVVWTQVSTIGSVVITSLPPSLPNVPPAPPPAPTNVRITSNI
jgi:type VI secretion system secreted protein VgrG